MLSGGLCDDNVVLNYHCLTILWFKNKFINFFWIFFIFCDKILKCHKNVISVTKSWMARFYMFSGDDIILTFYRFWLLRFVMWVIDVTFYRSSTGFFTFNNIPRQIFELDWSQDFSSNLKLKNLTLGMSDCLLMVKNRVFLIFFLNFEPIFRFRVEIFKSETII